MKARSALKTVCAAPPSKNSNALYTAGQKGVGKVGAGLISSKSKDQILEQK